MKSKAILMTLAMMSAALAGCTGSDGVAEIDDATLQELFDDNIQDFMNNTSVTVNQEIHYHNNTTVNNYETTNEYSNTTNVDGGEVINNYENNYSSIGSGTGNGSFHGAILHGIDFEFTLAELWGESEVEPGDRNNTYTTNWSYYDYLTNQQRNDDFTFSCSVYYLVGSASASNQTTYWEDNDYYHQAWEDAGYNSTMRDLFQDISHDSELRFTCDESFFGYSNNSMYYDELIYTITVPEGYSFRCLTLEYYDLYYRVHDDGSNGSSWQPSYSGAFWGVSTLADIIVNGIDTRCGSVNDYYIGNGEGFDVEIFGINLHQTPDYRLMFNYELRPVVTVE